jgi:hypothetical protein
MSHPPPECRLTPILLESQPDKGDSITKSLSTKPLSANGVSYRNAIGAVSCFLLTIIKLPFSLPFISCLVKSTFHEESETRESPSVIITQSIRPLKWRRGRAGLAFGNKSNIVPASLPPALASVSQSQSTSPTRCLLSMTTTSLFSALSLSSIAVPSRRHGSVRDPEPTQRWATWSKLARTETRRERRAIAESTE